jgi:ubiquinone/menaquinone biosynthesis C-methylase UbiE
MKPKTFKKNKNNTRIKSIQNKLKTVKKNTYEKDLNVTFYSPNYKQNFSCFANEYKNIQQDRYNYKKFYKSYESGQQIKTVVYLGIHYDHKILVQLIDLALKRFNPILINKIYKILISNKNDSEIYKDLLKLYGSPANKIKKITTVLCSKNKIISEVICFYLLTYKLNIDNYLDIGCGNGSFTSAFGKGLKLTKEHIFGVDFENFSEQGNWNRNKNPSNFIFKELENDKSYPFEDNFFDIITMKMVLHHIDNVDFTFKEISRILKNNGILIIIEHDAFTYADYMLNDIEHAFYINVFNENSLIEDYSSVSKKKKSDRKVIKSLDVVKYYDWVELDNLLMKYNFTYQIGNMLQDHIKADTSATRVKFNIYKFSK